MLTGRFVLLTHKVTQQCWCSQTWLEGESGGASTVSESQERERANTAGAQTSSPVSERQTVQRLTDLNR